MSNTTIGRHLDAWRQQMSGHLTDGSLREVEQEFLTSFLQQFSNLKTTGLINGWSKQPTAKPRSDF